MFDRKNLIEFVGDKSGNTYAYGLSSIEELCAVSIDEEYEKDQCASLISALEVLKQKEGISKSDLHELHSKITKLRKYIEFRKAEKLGKVVTTEQFRENQGKVPLATEPYEFAGGDNKVPTIGMIVAAYKADFERIDDEERYKWEAIAHYKNHWDIDAKDFAGMLRESLRYAGAKYKRPRDGKLDGGNLLTSSMYYPYKMVCLLSEQEPETMRTLFKSLLDESKPFSQRYTEFRDGCDKCLERYRNSAFNRKKLSNHYQDLRAMSVYLTFEYPEKYYLYKYKMYKSFAELLGLQAIRQTTQGEKAELALNGYHELCEKVLRVIKGDIELQEMSKARLDQDSYQDPEHHILAMDIIYFGSQLTKEEVDRMGEWKDHQTTRVTDIGLNTILYGPPGTGKTYNTIIYAVAIIEDKPLEMVKNEPYGEVFERFNTYKADGLVEFTTFHQSYGYEEFIEGIRPTLGATDFDGSSEIAYRVEPGIFKRICEKALPAVEPNGLEEWGINEAPAVWKMSLLRAGENPLRTECMENGHIRIGWDEWGPEPTEEQLRSSNGIINSFINRMRIGDIIFSCYSATTIDAIGIVTGEHEWHEEYPEFKRVRSVKWLVKGISESILDLTGGIKMTLAPCYRLKVSAEDALRLVAKYMGSEEDELPDTGRYVIIIDEINRGNISKIFGELITLIEPSKRLGQPEGATAKLPYSGKLFGVPDNVYIIGTMNTADRSIATIDTALRRRFQFKEMQPDPSVLEEISVEDISIKNMLERMNRKISILYDREHTIGHGYFMPLKEDASIEALASIFENSIIPLLQEYFYDDYEKIRLVLGDNIKEDEAEQFVVARIADYEDLFGTTDVGLDDAVFYQINHKALDNIAAYRFI